MFHVPVNLKSDLTNCKVYDEPLILDRVNTLLHDEVMKVAGCSERSIHTYRNAYGFVTKDIYSII